MEEKDIQTLVEAVRVALAPEFESLRQEIAGVRDELRQEIAGVRDELRRAVADLQRQIADLATRVANLERELANLTSRVANLERELANLTSRVANMERELANLTSRVANMEREFANLTSRVANMEREFANLTSRVANMEREFASLSEDVVQPFIQMVSADKKQKDEMLAHLDRQLTYLGMTATNTSTQLDLLSRNWRETADKTILVHKRVEALETRLSEDGVAELREIVVALAERVAKLEKSASAAKKRTKAAK